MPVVNAVIGCYIYPLFFVMFLYIQGCVTGSSNLALQKPVTMSTLYNDDAPGSNAVDGRKGGDWFDDGCASTKKENNSWIMVDLESQYSISSIFILNRLDGSTERLSHVHVEIGTFDSFTEVAYHHDAIKSSITFEFDPPYHGRFVKIWIEKYEFLTICEIEVYGNEDTISERLCTYEPRDCQDVEKTWSGVHRITPVGTYSGFNVFCDMEIGDGGWLTFQRRLDDSVDFNRTWNDYLMGFGEPAGNFWLGLRRLKSILLQGHYELRVDLEDASGNLLFAQYVVFELESHVDQYPLFVDVYIGTAGDGLSQYSLAPFSTPDRDHTSEGCAKLFGSGWWLPDCSSPGLNGLYPSSERHMNSHYMYWNSSDGSRLNVTKASMKIRRY